MSTEHAEALDEVLRCARSVTERFTLARYPKPIQLHEVTDELGDLKSALAFLDRLELASVLAINPEGYTKTELRSAIVVAVRRIALAAAKREAKLVAAALGAAQGIAEPPGNPRLIGKIQVEDITRHFPRLDEQLYVEEAMREAIAR